MKSLTEAAASPEVAEILASGTQHTDVAKRLTEMGYQTSEASVRRWRSRHPWSGLDLAERGYLVSEAMKPVELPEDPITILSCLDPYIGPAQRDLRVTRKTDSDGITTVTVTAVRDDFAETAANLMATRIATGDGEHRCLVRNKDGSVTVHLKGGMLPLFPPGTAPIRYQRFGQALVRKLRAVEWELTGNRDYRLTFCRGPVESTREMFDRILGRELDPAMQEIEEQADHRMHVHLQGL